MLVEPLTAIRQAKGERNKSILPKTLKTLRLISEEMDSRFRGNDRDMSLLRSLFLQKQEAGVQ